jgi:hypothetical protein
MDARETGVHPTKLLFQASALLEIMARAVYGVDQGDEEIASDAIQDAVLAVKRLVDDPINKNIARRVAVDSAGRKTDCKATFNAAESSR